MIFSAPVCVNKISLQDSKHLRNINGLPFCDNLVSKYLPRTFDSVSSHEIFKRNPGRLKVLLFVTYFVAPDTKIKKTHTLTLVE